MESSTEHPMQGDHARKKLKASSLFWFISSRHYVLMSEIRRRFQVEQTDGTVLNDGEGIVHIGLPETIARSLIDLKRKGKIGLEYLPEFDVRIAIGAYPMRVRPPDARNPDRAA